MIRAFEDRALLRHGFHHGLQRGTAILAPESVSPDVVDHESEPPAYAPEVLEPFLPEEPPSVGCAGILAPSPEQSREYIHGKCGRRTYGGNLGFSSTRISSKFDLL